MEVLLKKIILGVWYNHNSGSDGTLDSWSAVNLGTFTDFSYGFFGFSSHDYYYARLGAPGTNAPLPCSGKATIYHHGSKKKFEVKLSY